MSLTQNYGVQEHVGMRLIVNGKNEDELENFDGQSHDHHGLERSVQLSTMMVQFSFNDYYFA